MKLSITIKAYGYFRWPPSTNSQKEQNHHIWGLGNIRQGRRVALTLTGLQTGNCDGEHFQPGQIAENIILGYQVK
ncbi:MAG: hypothetical protein KJO26_11400 [Deltaproteobacteria bacterium]|nr:hypothetical protein [Deltaproteobacteria bacterium]NNK85851.1 hypothetical protein [Desulfobacterales bacterium]